MTHRSNDVFDADTRQKLIAAGVLRAPATVVVARKKPGRRAPKHLEDAESAFRAIGTPKRGDMLRIAKQFSVNPGTLHARIYGRP